MERNVVEELERLERFITLCVSSWNLNQDTAGYQLFIRSLQQLEDMVDMHLDGLGESEGQLLSSLENLYRYVNSKDIIAIGDVLQYELHPIIGSWKKGSDT